MQKLYIKQLAIIALLFTSFLGHSQTFQPIVLSSVVNSDACSMLQNNDISISVPSEALTGENINLNISLLGTFPQNENKTVQIIPSGGLVFGASPDQSFQNNSGVYESTGSLPGNQSQVFGVVFKFPNQITCNNATGTLQVIVQVGNQSCTLNVTVKARAANYWTISKHFLNGDRACGVSNWIVSIKNNNPNPNRYGNYKINGTITENVGLPVIGNTVETIVNFQGYIDKTDFSLRNCQDTGTIITNTVDYNFSLGNGCGTINGTINADSPPLVKPNAQLSFSKTALSSSNWGGGSNPLKITPGCDGEYRITLTNIGNVPLTNISISDDLYIPGLTINSITGASANWLATPNLPAWGNQFPTLTSSSVYNFSTIPGYELAPGDSKTIYIYFTLSPFVNPGDVLNNTAYVTCSTVGTDTTSSTNNTNPCSSINCPPDSTIIFNDTASYPILAVAPFSSPIMTKCILNPKPLKIYQIGDVIEFQLTIENRGSGVLNGSIVDNMMLPNQNLQLIGTPTFEFYEDQSWYKSCWNSFFNPSTITFPVLVDSSNIQNPVFNISNMPGNCDHQIANYLLIKFQAKVLPQMYGNKTNGATMSTNNTWYHGNYSYSVSRFGKLDVTKRADQELVENQGNFNFIVDVTNNGSEAIKNIKIKDNLPSCVSLQTGITVKDIAGNSINHTTNSNLEIVLDPIIELNPGQTFSITIPVKKEGGSQCCNDSVTASGNLTLSNDYLEAVYGSSKDPAACVKSAECCDIADLTATLAENPDGTYSVIVNGGAVPLQELEISMLDQHVEYSSPDCKPTNLGVFGNLETNNNTLGNLTLGSSSNGTGILSWIGEEPSVINTTINLAVSEPNQLALECCELDYSFCLKIAAKDVNCNVCEKIICPEIIDPIDPIEPCSISVERLNKEYCTGDNIVISWTSINNSSTVNINMLDGQGNSVSIYSGLSSPNSKTWTIPSNLIGCDKDWTIMISDSENEKCYGESNSFFIKCCKKECKCGKWNANEVVISKYLYEIYDDVDKKEDDASSNKSTLQKADYIKNPLTPSNNVGCGGTVRLKTNVNYGFEIPAYACSPNDKDCMAEYKWSIQYNGKKGLLDVASGKLDSYSSKVIKHTFDIKGEYIIIFTPVCGGIECEPCRFTVEI